MANIQPIGGGGAGSIVTSVNGLVGDVTVTTAVSDAAITSAKMAGWTVNAQTGTTYTLVLGDAFKIITLSNASAVTLTIPQNSSVALPIGTEIIVTGIGAGLVTVAAGTGTTINTPTNGSLVLARYQIARLIKIATNTWELQLGSRPPDGTALAVNASGQLAFSPAAAVNMNSQSLQGLTIPFFPTDAAQYLQTFTHARSAVSGTTATFATSDKGAVKESTNGSATTFTIPAQASVAFTTNTYFYAVKSGTGNLTILGDTGVQVNGVSAGSVTITTQWAWALIWQRAADNWAVVTFGGSSSSGDVVGPASATADAFPLYSGTTGKLLKDGAAPDGSTLEISGTTLRVKDSGITSAKIADGTIVNADINGSAAIAYSKLNLSSSVVSADIVDGTIVNGDINASAAIAGSKITPTFTADVSAPGLAITDTDGTGIATLADQTSAPSAPSTGNATVFAQKTAGRDFAVSQASTGSARRLVQMPWDRTWRLMRPGSSSTINVLGYGGAVNSVGTITTVAGSATTSPLSNLASAASASADATVARVDNFFRGASTDVFAGFFYHARLKFPDASYNTTGASTGSWLNVGMSNANPITARRGGSQHCAMFNREHETGQNTDTNWQFITNNSTTATVADTGMAFAVAKVYDFWIWCPAGSTSIWWQIDNVTDSTTANGVATLTLPGATTGVAQIAQLRTIDAVARTLQMACTYIEADRG